MGSGTWNPSKYKAYSTATATKTVDQIYDKKSMVDSLNPHGVRMRESRDSDDHPSSNAIIVGIDVTGSMGQLAEVIAKQGLGTLFNEILDRKPVTDPQLMFMAIGDTHCDAAPLQVSQFESDNVIVDQLTDIYVEGGGGGNNSESYNLPWYFAAFHTSIDCYEKRGKKGYLFTMGDEEPPPPLSRQHVNRFLEDTTEKATFSNKELLEMVGRQYEVFHLIVQEGCHMHYRGPRTIEAWKNLLGERALLLSDHTKLAEVIVSTIQVIEGTDTSAVVSSWSGDTSLVVKEAIKDLSTSVVSNNKGVTRF